MLGGDDLALPYPWVRRNGITIRGQWMYPPPGEREPHHAGQVGLLDLARFDVTEFGLDHANSAVAHAAKASGRFAVTVIRP